MISNNKQNPNYFSAELKILKVCGVSLEDNDNIYYKIYSSTLLFITPFFYLLVSLIDIFKERDMESMAARLVFLGCFLLGAIKVVVHLLNKKKLMILLEKLQTGYCAVDVERGGMIEVNLIKDCQRFNIIQRTAYQTMLFLCIFGGIVYSVISRVTYSDPHKWKLGFCAVTVLNTTYSPNYEIIMMYQNVAMIFASVQFITFDVLFCNIVAHLCVQFQIVQNSLKRILIISQKKMLKESSLENTTTDINVPSKYLHQSLKEIVLHHLEVINISKELENIYSLLLLIMYLINMVIFCFGLYKCSMMSVSDPQMRTVGNAAVDCWFQSLIICYWCHSVSEHSEGVRFAAYSANFVGTDESFQKSLAFIMRKTLDPVVLTAGNFFNITLTQFMKAQQFAYSSFMILHQQSQQ